MMIGSGLPILRRELVREGAHCPSEHQIIHMSQDQPPCLLSPQE